MKRRAETYASDASLVRSKYALKQFTKRLSFLRKSFAQDEASFYRDAAKSIKDFIGDKLNVTGSALTASEIERQLSESRVGSATVQECRAVIDSLEAGQFASRQYSQEEKNALLTSMKKVAREINKKIK
jgi:adenine-specific DNA methylase